MLVEFDQVLISGSDEEIFRYLYDLYDENKCVIVDHREEDDFIVNEFASKSGEDLKSEFTDEEFLITYKGEVSKISYDLLTDRYVTVQKIAELLKDKFEIRVFEISLGSDTHIFYIKPRDWWNYMDEHFPERMMKLFDSIVGKNSFTEASHKYIWGE